MRRRIGGMTLIELMTALGIGTFLMIGALTVFMQSRTTFRINQSIARLQENGRYVFDVMEPDVRMASYWGLRTRPHAIRGRAGPAEPVSPLAPSTDCGVNWTVNLDAPVESSNNRYGFTCTAYGAGGAVTTADTLVVRRVEEDPEAPAENSLYVQSTRAGDSEIFVGPAIPANYTAASQTHELVVNGYYVSRNSNLDTAGNPVPSLRRKLLRNGGAAGPVIADEEILPGVEDLQIQFGVDTDAEGAGDRGFVDRYVNADDPILDPADAAFNPDAEILAVRIWLRLRSELRENGIPADSGYVYADQNIAPINDGFRRIVVSKTIYLRNGRGPG